MARPARRYPRTGRLPRAVRRFDLDRSPEPDDEVPAERLQHPVELLVAEPTVGEQRDGHVVGEALVQPLDQLVLMIVPLVFEGRLANGQPNQRRSPAMAGDEVAGQRGVIVGIELGPIERNHDLLALTDHEPCPRGEQRPHLDPTVTEQAVGLLHPVLLAPAGRMRIAAARSRESTAQRRPGRRQRHSPTTTLAGRGDRLRRSSRSFRRPSAGSSRSSTWRGDSSCRRNRASLTEILPRFRSDSDHLRYRKRGDHSGMPVLMRTRSTRATMSPSATRPVRASAACR